MRNLRGLLVDALVKVHPRPALGGYRLQRVFRGSVVKRRRGRAGVWGFVLMAVGIGGLTWGNLVKFSPTVIGCLASIIGVTLVCSDWLAQRSDAANAAYRLGHDVGFERGEREGRAAPRPVVVPLRRPCACGRGEVEIPSAVASVADRG